MSLIKNGFSFWHWNIWRPFSFICLKTWSFISFISCFIRKLSGPLSRTHCRWRCSYLRHGEAAFPTGHHLVPFVVQHVHEAVRLVLTHQLRDVGGERRVLGEADAVACQKKWTEKKTPPSVQNVQRFLRENPPLTETRLSVLQFLPWNRNKTSKTSQLSDWSETSPSGLKVDVVIKSSAPSCGCIGR